MLRAELIYAVSVAQILENNTKLLSTSATMPTPSQFQFSWLSENEMEDLKNRDGGALHPKFFEKNSFIDGGFILLNDSTVLLKMFTH